MPEYSKLAPYRLKNTMLGINSDWCIDKTTLEIIKESEPAIQEYEDKWAQVDINNIVQEYIKEEVKDVYSMPLFTQEFCTMSGNEGAKLTSLYTSIGMALIQIDPSLYEKIVLLDKP